VRCGHERPARDACSIAAALIFASFAGGCEQESGAPSSTSIAGRYVGGTEATSTLEVQTEGDRFVVLLSGGAQAGAGAATPADCYVRAVGTIQGDTLVAGFTSLETDVFYYDAAQADREKRKVAIRFAAGDAEVLSADTDGYCGLGITFLGPYRRVRTQ
jgi:hypothetical protein